NPSLSAGEVERALLGQLRKIFASPEVLAHSYRAARARQDLEIQRIQAERNALDVRRQELTVSAQRALEATGRGRSAAFQRISEDLDALEERHRQISADLEDLKSVHLWNETSPQPSVNSISYGTSCFPSNKSVLSGF